MRANDILVSVGFIVIAFVIGAVIILT